MLRLLLILSLVFIFGTNLGFASVTEHDFTFHGVSLLTGKYEDVITKMGEPKRKVEDEAGAPAFTYLTYRNIYIQAYKDTGKIAYIKIADRDYHTERNVSLGSTPSKIVKEYGMPEKESIRGHIYYVYKLADNLNYRLLIDMTEGYASYIIYTNLIDKP